MRTSIIVTALLLAVSSIVYGQTQKDIDTTVKATDFAIPASGAFTLLGVNPASVSSPGSSKDIKLDYFLDGTSLKPNIAFEFQPVWLLWFKNRSLDEYKKFDYWKRLIGHTSISFGTAEKDGLKKMAYSLRLSFAKDPMTDDTYIGLINEVTTNLTDSRTLHAVELTKKKKRNRSDSIKLAKRIDSLQTSLNGVPVDTANLSEEIRSLWKRLSEISADNRMIDKQLNADDEQFNKTLISSLKKAQAAYEAMNWHKPKMDIGIGRSHSYQNGSLTQLGVTNAGLGIWMNPSIGCALSDSSDLKLLFTGIVKYIDQDESAEQFYGANIRLGSKNINFFAEFTYGKGKVATTRTVAYGGSLTINGNKLLELGLRTNYAPGGGFKQFMPVLAINWQIAQGLFK